MHQPTNTKKVRPWHQRLVETRFRGRRSRWLLTLALIGISALSVRLLFAVNLGHSGLLYLLVPYCIALLIAAFRPTAAEKEHQWGRDLSLSSLIVLFGSSIVLGEGFICVLFFLPFYFLAIGLVALTKAVNRRGRNKSRTHVSLVPLLVLVASLEGTTPALTAERSNLLEQQAVIAHTPAQILKNLERPIQLETARHWLLKIFPMPELLAGQTLTPGERHQLTVHYPRWMFANVHSGMLELQVVEVGISRVLVKVTRDTTLFNNYIDLTQLEIRMNAISEKQTAVTLSIAYKRKLDPAWYFQPMTRFAIARMADHLIAEVISHD